METSDKKIVRTPGPSNYVETPLKASDELGESSSLPSQDDEGPFLSCKGCQHKKRLHNVYRTNKRLENKVENMSRVHDRKITNAKL